MPGKHSACKLAERRARALQRGFLQPRPKDIQYVQVPCDIALKAKAEVKALALHSVLNKAAGKPHHFAAHAALAARGTIGEEAFCLARATIKRGNVARQVTLVMDGVREVMVYIVR